MGSNSDNMRKLLNVLSEDGPLAPGAFVDPLAAPTPAINSTPSPAMNDPMDDAPTTGPETKVEVTMKDGDDVEVWNEIGTLHIKMEAYKKAQEALSKALEINPNFGPAHLNLAIVLAKLGKNQESISHCFESIGLLKNRQDKELPP